MFFTLANMTFIPMGVMYLHATDVRMFCMLTDMSSILMGAINFYMQEHFFTLADTTFIPKGVM